MTHSRPWIPILLAGCVCTQLVIGQTSSPGFGSPGTGGTGTSGGLGGGTAGGGGRQTQPGSGSGAGSGTAQSGSPGSTTGSGTQPAAADPPAAPPRLPGTGTPTRDPFGFDSPSQAPSPFGAATTPGASTTFGLQPRNAAPAGETETTVAAPAPAPTSEPPTYTLPNFYGRPGEVLTAGQGRLARPRFRYGASFSMGFDDNSQQTPDNQEDIPAQTIRQVIPAEPEIAVFQPEQVFAGYRVVVPPGPNPQPGIVPVYRTVQRKVVLRPAQPEQVFETEVPGVDFGERNASVVSRLDIHGDAQWANARSAFTMDLRAGAEYYWNRDEDPLEYNGSFSVNYLRRLNPRTQVSAALSLSYLSQPDYSQVNLVDTGSGGNYLVANAKLDLNYRWAPRWSTVTSLSGNSILYEGAREAASYWEATLGNELRWIQSRRTTWIIEARYSELNYFKQEVNSVINTIFLLVGADWTFGRKWRSTIRLGEASRSFESGGRSSSPYGEASLIYQPNRRDQFTLSTRYGYEATQTAEQENTALRVAGAYAHTFSPRLFGSLSLNYVRNNYTVAQQSSSSEIYDASAFLQYAFSRRFSMNARYSYVLSKSSTGFSDYDRSRFFLTAVYDF